MDKARLYERAQALGIRVPWVRSARSPNDVSSVVAEAPIPCVVKPALSHVGKSAGDYGATLVESHEGLRDLLARATADGVEMLVTEHVPGGEDELEGAVVIRDRDGSYPLVYGRRKVRQYPLDFGPGSLTRSATVPETVEITKRICDDAAYAGVASLEVKRHAGTGERVLIEINVRVVQSFGLGDACGVDASWRLYATLAGIPLAPQPPQRDGRAVVSPGFDLLAVRQRLRRGDVTLPEVIRSYRGTRDLSVLDPRDPRPGVALGAFFLRSKLEKRRRRTPS